jgi:molybdopterin molybdotransferase
MLTVAEATAIVLEHARPLPVETTPLAEALGRVLAEDVASDLDMPPFDKAMMDGYAVRSADVASGNSLLEVIDEITAGNTPKRALAAGQAARIMTGAPIPTGADAVVMVERCEMCDNGRVSIQTKVRAGENVQPRAHDLTRGEIVLQAGSLLRPQEIGLLATVGRAQVRTFAVPEVAVLSTGDELVEPGAIPAASQIRNSNGPMLAAQASRCGVPVRTLGIARDTVDDLTSKIRDGLKSDILILSGGVSAGKLDLVPGVMAEQGVTPHFHKIAMKPGKPIFFGSTKSGTLVFGLPGNPVSAFVGFELFVRPAIDVLRGMPRREPRFQSLPLVEEYQYSTDRPTYHPARMANNEVQPVSWKGSPDLRALTLANALVLLPVGEHRHAAGTMLPVLSLEDDARES